MLMNLLRLFFVFLKIGAVAFGGGYGIVPVIRQEMLSLGWITDEKLLDMIGISESTPGPIAVNMATFVGYEREGVLGAIVATLGVVLPAFLVMLLVYRILARVRASKSLGIVLDAIRAVVVGLVVATGVDMMIGVFFTLPLAGAKFAFDFRALIVFAALMLFAFAYKRIRKKSLSPIALIAVSMLLGMVAYSF